ncbi:unnamed protein product [Moneuplotes crassus]|uniref:Uncharacterized protein n=1 Tax=Euplotes crassus TaxID=5936 RepID=A0AAD1XQW4_EUPCR|nr:unnamed protein product [Moneuplotes crassus]
MLTQISDINDPNYLYPGNVFASSLSTPDSENFEPNFYNWESCKENSQVSDYHIKEKNEEISERSPAVLSQTSYDNTGILTTPKLEAKSPNQFTNEKQKTGSLISKRINNSLKKKNFSRDTQSYFSLVASEISSCEPSKPVRKDLNQKASLRMLRRYYRNSFKSKNIEIVRKRYIHCSDEYIYQRMRVFLEILMPQEDLSDNLIYFTTGIISLREVSSLPCSQAIKEEIKMFHLCCRSFSQRRFTIAMQSESLRSLCSHLIENSNNPAVENLRQKLCSEINEFDC